MKWSNKYLAVVLSACIITPGLTTIAMKNENADILNVAKNMMEEGGIEEVSVHNEGMVFEKSNFKITQGNGIELKSEEYGTDLMSMEGGTFIIQYTSTSSSVVQSLFSISNGDEGNDNRHFHVYIQSDGSLGAEIRNTDGVFKYSIKANNSVKTFYKGESAKNTIAFKADKENGVYKLFANGMLVQTLDANSLKGFKFINDINGVNSVMIGSTLRGGTQKYQFEGTIHKISVYKTSISDEKLIEETGATNYDALQQIFHSNDSTNSNYFRIPTILTLKDGTVLSSIDARFGGTHDSPNNIDIAVSRSEDAGKTWSNPIMPLHFDDFADTKIELPIAAQLRVNGSASFIDSQLLEDRETGRVFLIADGMPSGYGAPQAVIGSGYKEISGKKYLKLKRKGERDYNYTLRDNRIIYDDRTNSPTEYSLNSNYEILKNDVLQLVKQKDVAYAENTIKVTTTDKDVAMNIMYNSADFQVLPTTYLYMKYSDDSGKTWSDPIILNDMVKAENNKMLITGPGRGIQIKNGEYKGRLLIPAYEGSRNGVIYSDDHGFTWKYVVGPRTTNTDLTESQIVEMPDGSLAVYGRTSHRKIATAVSLDGGETWSDAKLVNELPLPGWGSQISVINYSGVIDGKPALILSSPDGVGNFRKAGKVRIGLINDTGKEGIEKYSIDWKYTYSIDEDNVGYSYSSLTELPNKNIGVIYEKYDSYNPKELHSKDIIKYEELKIEDIMKK